MDSNLRNIIWLVSEKVVKVFVSFFVGVLVIRYLGPEDYGTLIKIYSIVFILASVASFGMEGVVRRFVQYPTEHYEIIGTAFFIRTTAVSLLYASVLIAIFVVQIPIDDPELLLIALCGQFFMTTNVIDGYFQSLVKGRWIALIQTAILVISNSLKLAFIYLGLPLIYFAGAYALESVVFSAGNLYFYVNSGRNLFKWTINLSLAKNIIATSFPLLGGIVFTSAALKMDMIIISAILGDSNAGLYAASFRMLELFLFLPVVVTTTFFPTLASEDNNEKFEKKARSINSALTLIGFSVGLFLILFRDILIVGLLGEDFSFAASLLAVHALVLPFFFSYSLRKKILIAKGKYYHLFAYAAMTAIANVILVTLFTSYMGVFGAALGILFGWTLSICVFPFLIGRSEDAYRVMSSYRFSDAFSLFSDKYGGSKIR